MPGPGEAGLGTEVLIGQKARPWAPLRGLEASQGPPDRGQEAPAPASRGVAQPRPQQAPGLTQARDQVARPSPTCGLQSSVHHTRNPQSSPNFWNPSQKDNSCQAIANRKKV